MSSTSASVSLNNKIVRKNLNLGQIEELSKKRLKQAKAAYNVRNIPLEITRSLLKGDDIQPDAGDLVLARVVNIGQHQRIELGCGRRAGLYIDDEIIVCYGARYAPDQFEAYVPQSLAACHLVAAGGIAAECANRHNRIKPATEILPLGLLVDAEGNRINIRDWSLKSLSTKKQRPPTVAVFGTSMNAGKTTTAAGVVHRLKTKGLNVAAAKITGTGAGGDRWKLVDAGADIFLDFTDAGLSSTFGIPLQQLESIFSCLMDNLCQTQPDVIVLEIADGLYQRETANILNSEVFKTSVDGVIFAAREALGAEQGAFVLRKKGYSLLAISGAINASPLAKREAENALDLPLFTPEEVGELVFERLLTASDAVQPKNRVAQS